MKKRIFAFLLLAALLLVSFPAQGHVSHAAEHSHTDSAVTVELITGAIVGTDSLMDAIETVNAFGGSRITLHADITEEERISLYGMTVTLDLNGHTLTGLDMALYNGASCTIIDSTANGGAIEEALLYVDESTLTIDSLTLNAWLSFSTKSTVTAKGITSESLYIELLSESTSVTLTDATLDTVEITKAEGSILCFDNVTISGELSSDSPLSECINSACHLTTDGEGAALILPDDGYYSGPLHIRHNKDAIDRTVWVSAYDGHFHACACGYRADFAPHTGDAEACTVCEAVAPLRVSVGDSHKSFFTLEEAFTYAEAHPTATVTLCKDIILDGADLLLNLYGDAAITVDLAGFSLEITYAYLYDNIALHVIDSSTEGTGWLSFSGYIDLNDRACFSIEGGELDGDIYLYENSCAILDTDGSLYANLSEDTASLWIKGGEYGSLELFQGNNPRLYFTGGTVTHSLYTDAGLHALFDKDCLTLVTENGNAITPDDTYFDATAGALTVTHDDTRFSTELKGENGYHGKICADCGVCDDPTPCSGGTATCEEGAICEVCHTAYGETAPHTLGNDGKCTLCGEDAILRLDADGRTLYFFDLQAAFDAAKKADAATITLLKSLRENGEIALHANVTLDLNGYQLFIEELNIYAQLTIDDSSDAESGSFTTDSTLDVCKDAHLILKKGGFSAEDLSLDAEEETSAITILGGIFGDLYIEMVADNSLLILKDFYAYYLYIFAAENANAVILGGICEESLYFESEDDLSTADLLAASCLTLYDENGDVMEKDGYGYGYIEIVHDDSHEATTYTNAASGHYLACECGMPKSDTLLPHTGGTATCEERAICTDCHVSYGDRLSHSFTDDVCTVCGGKAILLLTAEGYSERFCTPSEAFDAAAKYPNATLTLLTHVVDHSFFVEYEGIDLTIDLAGYNLALREMILESSTVVLKDSNPTGNGALLGYYIDLTEASSLVIDGGDIYLSIYAYDDAEITINDADFSSEVGLYADDNATITIHGGTFTDIHEIDVDDNAVLTIDGGTFRDEVFIIEYDENATVRLMGGVFRDGICLEIDEAEKNLTFADILPNGYTLRDADGKEIPTDTNRIEGYVAVVPQGIGIGAIIAIAVGGAAVVGIGVLAIVWFAIKKRTFADLLAVFKK